MASHDYRVLDAREIARWDDETSGGVLLELEGDVLCAWQLAP
jgi:hypothetical protein